MTTLFFVIGAIAGMLLGFRFKVFVLLPATVFAAAIVVASGHEPRVIMALTVFGTVVLLQIGYLVICTFRFTAGAHLHNHSLFNSKRVPKQLMPETIETKAETSHRVGQNVADQEWTFRPAGY